MKTTQRCELDFAGEQIFVGLDVHLKSWKVTLATKDIVMKTFTQPPSPEH